MLQQTVGVVKVLEFRDSIQGVIKHLAFDHSIILALIYTAGHIIIAMSVVSIMTGASFFEAGAVALIEPAINGCWFYILHKLWTKIYGD